MSFQIKRIYVNAQAEDGVRVLVDRLWPRGISKRDARLDHWLKDIAPSPELRTWFDHRADRFEQFQRQYTAELSNNPATDELARLGKKHVVTLLYGAKDPRINHACVLREVLLNAGTKHRNRT
jgi:uncharacterized protein YeaO (DUF488 family)